MSFAASCPSCDHRAAYRDEDAGREVTCAGCQQPFTLKTPQFYRLWLSSQVMVGNFIAMGVWGVLALVAYVLHQQAPRELTAWDSAVATLVLISLLPGLLLIHAWRGTLWLVVESMLGFAAADRLRRWFGG